MTLLYRIGAPVLLVLFTLSLQCIGVAGLITWLRRVIASDISKLRISNSAALVMRRSAMAMLFYRRSGAS